MSINKIVDEQEIKIDWIGLCSMVAEIVQEEAWEVEQKYGEKEIKLCYLLINYSSISSILWK